MYLSLHTLFNFVELVKECLVVHPNTYYLLQQQYWYLFSGNSAQHWMDSI